MQFDEDSTFTKLESFVDENGISANITTGGVYMASTIPIIQRTVVFSVLIGG